MAAELLKNLDVSNDARSMLIRISYTSTSPEQSARIANAFAEEYLRTRIGLAARRRLTNSFRDLRSEAPYRFESQI